MHDISIEQLRMIIGWHCRICKHMGVHKLSYRDKFGSSIHMGCFPQLQTRVGKKPRRHPGKLETWTLFFLQLHSQPLYLHPSSQPHPLIVLGDLDDLSSSWDITADVKVEAVVIKTLIATYTDVCFDDNDGSGQLAWRSSVWSEAARIVHKIRCSWSSDRQNTTSNLNEPHDARPTAVAL